MKILEKASIFGNPIEFYGDPEIGIGKDGWPAVFGGLEPPQDDGTHTGLLIFIERAGRRYRALLCGSAEVMREHLREVRELAEKQFAERQISLTAEEQKQSDDLLAFMMGRVKA